MIGDRDVLVTAFVRSCRHLGNTSTAVTPNSVHLQITSQPLRPFRIRGENNARVRPGKKIAPDWRRLKFLPGQFFDPSLELFRNERPDAVKFGERTPGS